MAISDDIQRYMPSAADRVAPRCAPLAYKEAVLLVDPMEPQFKGEVDDKYQYSLDNKDNAVHGWIRGSRTRTRTRTNPAMGFWVITPSNEFKSGGPMKRELTSHVGPVSMAVRKYKTFFFLLEYSSLSVPHLTHFHCRFRASAVNVDDDRNLIIISMKPVVKIE